VTITTSVADAAAQPLLPSDWTATQGLGLTSDTPHATAAGVIAPSALATSDGIASLGHFDWLATGHDSTAFHLHA